MVLGLEETAARILKSALLSSLPVWGLNPRFALSEPKTRVASLPVVWGAPSLVLHTPLNPVETKLLQAMCAVIKSDPEADDIPCLTLSQQVLRETLVKHICFWRPASVWLVGERVARFFLRTDETIAKLRAKQPLSVKIGYLPPLPVIVTEHPRDITDDIVTKRRIYQDLLKLKAKLY